MYLRRRSTSKEGYHGRKGRFVGLQRRGRVRSNGYRSTGTVDHSVYLSSWKGVGTSGVGGSLGLQTSPVENDCYRRFGSGRGK